jgi:hypothetical protein
MNCFGARPVDRRFALELVSPVGLRLHFDPVPLAWAVATGAPLTDDAFEALRADSFEERLPVVERFGRALTDAVQLERLETTSRRELEGPVTHKDRQPVELRD